MVPMLLGPDSAIQQVGLLAAWLTQPDQPAASPIPLQSSVPVLRFPLSGSPKAVVPWLRSAHDAAAVSWPQMVQTWDSDSALLVTR